MRNLSISTTSLLNRESFEEVLSIAGVYNFCPTLLPLTMGKAKKEHALGESHHTDGGGAAGGGGRGEDVRRCHGMGQAKLE